MDANWEELEVKVETSQEKTETVAEHYEGAPCIKAVHVFTALQGLIADILHEAPKGATYRKIIRATEDQFWEQQLRTWT
jgi:hypothetical protein